MNTWPDGWQNNSGGRGGGPGRQGDGGAPDPARRMPHVARGAGDPAGRRADYGGYQAPPAEPRLPPEMSPRRGGSQQPQQQYGGGGPGGYGGGYGGGGSGGGGRSGRPVKNWRKRIKWIVITLVTLLVVTGVGTYLWADSKLNREDVLADYQDRPDEGKGTNYLVVGSDSREGLTKADRQRLHAGGPEEGKRTDSMMILHTGEHGNTLLSLPRDSFVTIPAFKGPDSGKQYPSSRHKLNRAFAMGGAPLLARTIEYNTGLRMDHYAEIGFGGFVDLVDALGGVNMCFDEPLKDKASGADFKKGCHDLNGAQSLAFVRQRHQESDQDLGRMRNQQKFLSTLAHQAASPSTVLNPFRLYPTLGAGLDALIVDDDMSLFNLGSMFWAMKGVTSGDGDGQSITVPVGSANYQTPSDGVALKWDMNKAKRLFEQMKQDEEITAGQKK